MQFSREIAGDSFLFQLKHPALTRMVENAQWGDVRGGLTPQAFDKLIRTQTWQCAMACMLVRTDPALTFEHPFLKETVARGNLYAEIFAEKRALPFPEACRLANAFLEVAPLLDVRLAERLAHGSKARPQADDDELRERLLGVLESLDPGPRIWMMVSQMLRVESPAVRSRSAFVLIKATQNARFAQKRLDEEDAGMRENVVKALWGLRSPQALDVFRNAQADVDCRVAVSALVGLHLAGIETAFESLARRAVATTAEDRAAAAWGLGETGDTRALDPLQALSTDLMQSVRLSAASAIQRIQSPPVKPVRKAIAAPQRRSPTAKTTVRPAKAAAPAGPSILRR